MYILLWNGLLIIRQLRNAYYIITIVHNDIERNLKLFYILRKNSFQRRREGEKKTKQKTIDRLKRTHTVGLKFHTILLRLTNAAVPCANETSFVSTLN